MSNSETHSVGMLPNRIWRSTIENIHNYEPKAIDWTRNLTVRLQSSPYKPLPIFDFSPIIVLFFIIYHCYNCLSLFFTNVSNNLFI